jgi:hypothetical protein
MACLVTGTTLAATTLPDSYSMQNGTSGTYQYWDQSYNGKGCVTCNYAQLSGGRGDLTDGIIASTNAIVAEAPAGNGPYVGWALDPTITFHWNKPVSIGSVTFYLDDSNGAGFVSAPKSVTVKGVTYNIAEPAGSAPFAFTATGVNFTGTDLTVSLQRKNSWVFLSEVQFQTVAAPVPEPDTYVMMLGGLALAGGMARRRRRAAGDTAKK